MNWLHKISQNNDSLYNKYDLLYPKAGSIVGGLSVLDDIPNLTSISSSFEDWEELPGIREVPMSDFVDPKNIFYAKNDFDRSKNLAERIKQSGQIAPLIIGVEDEGPYILEGVHRFVALHYLGIKSFPALVVLDQTEYT